MNKRIIGGLLTICFALGSMNVFAISERPEMESEYGYIFTIKGNSAMLFDSSAGKNIDIISETENIYHADSLQDIRNVSKLANIDLIAKDMPVELYDYPNDTNDEWYTEQWSHQVSNISSYWKYNIDGTGVRVGIIDTGIQRNHPDLQEVNIDTGVNICALLEKRSDDYFDTDDYNGHGTQVSGIIAATVNNGIGIAGITDKCTIEPVSIYDKDSKYSLTVGTLLTALEYLKQEHCDVINMSLGFKNPSDALVQLITNLVDSITKDGTIIIAAVGNSGVQEGIVEYPAACNNTVGVGAVAKTKENTFNYAQFSSASKSVLVSAPGEKILTLNNNLDMPYIYKDGTSFAAPIVTAAAIGAKQVYPDINADNFKNILQKTSVDIEEKGYDIKTGYGLVDFDAIYRAVEEIALNKPTPTVEPTIIPTVTPTTETTVTPTTVPVVEYDIETNILYDKDKNVCICTATNNTKQTINAIGIIAVYSKNGILKYLETVEVFPVGRTRKMLDFALSDGDRIKWFVWNSLSDMQPLENVKLVEYLS